MGDGKVWETETQLYKWWGRFICMVFYEHSSVLCFVFVLQLVGSALEQVD